MGMDSIIFLRMCFFQSDLIILLEIGYVYTI